MFDFKQLFFGFSLFLLLPLGALANKTVYVRKSVAFDAFPKDTGYKTHDPKNIGSGHHTSGSYPDSFPPANPLHDDDDKFEMRCQSNDWDDDPSKIDNCKILLTVDMTWNQNIPNKLKTCTLEVTLGADGSTTSYKTTRKYDVSGDCSVDEKTIDGVGAWVVHPKTIAGKRTTTVKFKGTFTDTQAATWADQIYRNLAPSLKDQVGLYTPSYNLNDDKTELTFTMPAYFEVPYTCQDWC